MNTDYRLLNRQLAQVLEGIPYVTPCLSNASALLYSTLSNINWAGFYLLADGGLWLGPFQGLPACVHIPLAKGVCGAAFTQNTTLRIEDVHKFPGHIACDSASNSEIVIPLRINGQAVGVLDIDSPNFNRFTPADQQGLEEFARVLEAALGKLHPNAMYV